MPDVNSDVINPIVQKFESLKIELDKSPNAFQLKFSKEKGYYLIINEDCLLGLVIPDKATSIR